MPGQGARRPAGGARRGRYFSFEDRPGENPWLDLLRCIAIALVLLRHGHRVRFAASDDPAGWPDFVMLNGWIGVDLFLVLSGYLIGRILIGERDRRSGSGPGGRLRRYLVKRALRILPAYYAVLLVTALGLVPLAAPSQQDLGWRLAYHAAMLQDYLPSDINIAFWSLGVEAKFYLLAPLLVALVLRAESARVQAVSLAGLVLLSPAVRSAIFAAAGAPADYDAFWPVFRSPFHATTEPLILGVGVALLEARGLLRLGPRGAKLMLTAALAAVLVWVARYDFTAGITVFDATLQPLLLAMLFAAAVAAAVSMADVPLRGRAVARAGARLSYGLYLVHYPLLPLSIVIGALAGGGAAAFWAAFLGLSLGAALLLHFVVEKPFLLLRGKGPALSQPAPSAALREPIAVHAGR